VARARSRRSLAGWAGSPRRDDAVPRPGVRLVPLPGLAGGLPGPLGLEALDRPRLVHVQREAFRPPLDDVGEDDLVEDVVLGEPLRGGRAVEPGPDDAHLSLTGHVRCFSFDVSLSLTAAWPGP